MRLKNVSKVKFAQKEMLADKIKEGKITKKWIERCLPQEYRRYAKSEQSSLSGRAKKLEKIIIVDNEGNTVAGDETSPYNSSTIDNSSAFTQPRGRDAIQPIQKEHDEYVLEGDGDEAWSRSRIRRSALQPADQRS